MSGSGSGLGREIVRPIDAQLELQDKGLRLVQRMRFLGVFTGETVARMNPPPAVGDMWFVFDSVAGTTTGYVQVQTTRQRVRVAWDAALELA